MKPHAVVSASALVLAAVAAPAFGQAMKKDSPPPKAEPAPAAAAGTHATGIFPSGGPAGSTVNAVVEGGALTGATAVWFGHPGLAARITAGADDAVKVEVKIAADVPPGLYPWRIAAAKGVSAPRMFAVSPPKTPEAAETEPNDDPAKASAVEIGSVVSGRLDKYEDMDCFRFAAKAGQRLLVNLRCRALGSAAEPAIALSDIRGKLLATPDRHGQIDGDPFLDHTFAESGEYVVQVWNLVRGDDAGRLYRLSITAAPRVQFAFPAGVRRGQAVPVELGVRDPSGAAGGRPVADTPFALVPVTVTVPGDFAGDRFPVRLPGKTPSEAVELVVGDLPETLEGEPNDDPAKPNPVAVPSVVNGRLNGRGDLDHFRFAGKKGRPVILEIDAAKLGFPGDLAVAVLDDKGKQLAANDDSTPADSDPRLVFTPAEDGDYLVRVSESVPERITGPEHIYRLTLRSPEPDFALTAPQHTVSVAPGGTGVLPVVVERIDGFAGEVKLTVTGLPAEFKAVVEPVKAGASAGAVRFTGPAALVGRAFPVQIRGESEVDGKPAVRTAAAVADLVRLDGKVVNTHRTATLFVGVGKAPPAFSLEPSPTRVEAGPGSDFTLKITAKRAAGVTGAIDLTVVAGPEGTVGAKAQIPAGKDSVDLKLKLGPSAGPAALLIEGVTQLGATTGDVTAPPVDVAVRSPAFSAELPVTALFGRPGGTVELPVEVKRDAGYTGAVALAASGLPGDFAVQGGTVPNGKGSGAVVIKVPAAAKPGVLKFAAAATGPVAGRPKTVELPTTLKILGPDDPEPPPAVKLVKVPEFTVDMPAMLTAKPGQTLDIPVKVGRKEGFARSVTITTANLPKGFGETPVRIPGDAKEGVYKISIPAGAGPRAFTLLINATSTIGDVRKTLPTRLMVLTVKPEEPKKPAKPAEPKKTAMIDEFSVTFPAKLAAKPGRTVEVPVSVKRKRGFARSVTITAAGLPKGFAETPVKISGGDSAGTYKIAVPADAKPGAVPAITLNATSTVNDKRITIPVGTLTLTVEKE